MLTQENTTSDTDAVADRWQEFYLRLEENAKRLTDPATGLVKQSLVREIPCPHCGSMIHSTLVVKQGFRYVTCSACGFVFVNPQLREEVIKNVYNDDSVRRYFFTEMLLPFVERDQRPEFQGRVSRLMQLAGTPHPRLLDIGCAAGNFMMVAQEAGCLVEGIELNDLYIDFIRQHRSLDVHARPLEAVGFPANHFEVVTLWDVLEHLPQPQSILREVFRILKPGGIVAASTINHACLNAKLLKDRWRYFQPPDHLCSFTPALIRTMFREAGFETESLEHHYMLEVLQDGLFRPLGKRRGWLATKFMKVARLVFTKAGEAILEPLHQGDLITIYARKAAR